jgi:hypothetical protein
MAPERWMTNSQIAGFAADTAVIAMVAGDGTVPGHAKQQRGSRIAR